MPDLHDRPAQLAVQLLGQGARFVAVLGRAVPSHLDTSWGPLDVFVGTPRTCRDVSFETSCLTVALVAATS